MIIIFLVILVLICWMKFWHYDATNIFTYNKKFSLKYLYIITSIIDIYYFYFYFYCYLYCVTIYWWWWWYDLDKDDVTAMTKLVFYDLFYLYMLPKFTTYLRSCMLFSVKLSFKWYIIYWWCYLFSIFKFRL